MRLRQIIESNANLFIWTTCVRCSASLLASALIHSIQPFNVASAERLRADPIAVTSIDRNYCVLTVSGESPAWIVHDRQQIVAGSEVIEKLRIHHVEREGELGNDVLPEDLHETIAIGMIVHVVVAQCMNYFVCWNSPKQATRPRQGQLLSTADSPQPRPATVAINDVDEVVVIVALHKANARRPFNHSKFGDNRFDFESS